MFPQFILKARRSQEICSLIINIILLFTLEHGKNETENPKSLSDWISNSWWFDYKALTPHSYFPSVAFSLLYKLKTNVKLWYDLN